MTPPHTQLAGLEPAQSEAPTRSAAPLRSLIVPASRTVTTPELTTSEALVAALVTLGVKQAFGVFGGGIGPFCEALSRSPIRLMHCRSESGAAFAAVESSLASGSLAVVVATTGPGLTSLVTGMAAARSEGAHVLFVSGVTTAARRGRGAFQETTPHASGLGSLWQSGPLVHHAQVVEHPAELGPFCARLATGIQAPSGFVAHLGLPLGVQTAPTDAIAVRVARLACSVPARATLERCRELLEPGRFAIWVGYGARHCAAEVRELAERTAAPVMCSPRAKGVMPESHPLYLGVTGLGGHGSVADYFERRSVDRVLVLGSRLGEMTSFWSSDLVPERGFVHVDVDAAVFGAAYPDAPTLGVQCDAKDFLRLFIDSYPEEGTLPLPQLPLWRTSRCTPSANPLVRYSALMHAVQRWVIEQSDSIVLTEAGNSFMLGSHYLSFDEPGRYRVSTQLGSMGQASAGVLGAAAVHGKAVALSGDGSLLMFNELSTAAKYRIPAVWIVINDARYGMVEEGMRAVGWEPFETDFPRTDFVAVAHAMGVPAVRVGLESELERALTTAMRADGPFLVDVWIDLSEPVPSNRRNASLFRQGVSREASE